VETNTFRK